ncbi:SGNH/GDSL hydrolase family protein [Paenibacillus castaneae]|uniref:SGNH/GDSL hydrolase family protein n=1 Tax=Paenibacillus castaneae TaxID=474957 RepID=UPI000C9CED61|nr:SGNH/GDSL hydrolase family protein [Paenibacillus castaneae]
MNRVNEVADYLNNGLTPINEPVSGHFDLQEHARYIGRMDWSDPRGPILSWAGSSIAIRFQGSAISLNMVVVERENTWFDITLNGGEPRKLHIGETGGVISIAEGLDPNAVHLFEIYKRTEAMFGTVQFLGAVLPEGGSFLAPPPHKDRRIEIIGDSISVGSGNEGKDGDPNIAEHENNSLAYGTLAALALDAEHHTVAISGIGLTVNYGDERVNTMKDQYELLNPLHAEPKWDFSQWIPHVVVINLGTNDNNYKIDPAEFVQTYAELVSRIRKRYPAAQLFMTLGPFQASPVKEHIYEANRQIREAGDVNVHYFLFDEANAERDGMGETGHPNVITHALMAQQLVGEIKQKTGW